MMLLNLSVRQLRGRSHAEEKNREMMRRLWECEWFVDYRKALTAYREGRGRVRRPVYPDALVEEVERAVDEWMAARYPGYVR